MKSTEAFKEVIKNYLEDRAAKDELFAKMYANESKSLDNCINYIFKTVKQSGCNGFADEEIFSMALHYYNEENLTTIEDVSCEVVVNHSIKNQTADAALAPFASTPKEIKASKKKVVKSDESQISLF